MVRNINVIENAEKYLKEFDIDKSVEELFSEFQMKVNYHSEFEEYLKLNGINQRLELMQRNQRLLAKRKLFTEWYLMLNQNKHSIKEILIDLPELTFASKRTAQKDLSSEATV